MRLLFDMDDVLENLSYVWVDRLNNKYGLDVSRDSIREWEMAKAFPTLSREQIYSPFYDDGFWGMLRPLDGAVETVKHLIDMKHQVYVVTSSGHKSLSVKMENALFNNFPFLTWDNVIVTSHKELIIGDIIFDDGLHNLSAPFGNDGKTRVVFDAPWNRGGDDFPIQNMILEHVDYRVRNWSEVRDVIREVSERKRTCTLEKLKDNKMIGGEW